ncbi:MAG: lactate racemase domain-containing protein [Bacillota bacterium]
MPSSTFNFASLNAWVKEGITVELLKPHYPAALDPVKIRQITRDNLHSMLDSISGSGRVVLILEDPSRPSKTGPVVEEICGAVQELRGEDRDFEVVIAAGAHYNIQGSALQKKTGRLNCPVTIHNSVDNLGLLRIGTSKSGIPLYFNKKVVTADFRLSISTMNLHPLAGLSAGGKILLPGVAGLETIEAFHSLPSGAPGESHSAMRDLINEALALLPINYSWHLLSNPEGELLEILGGRVAETFEKSGGKLLKTVTVKKPEKPADILLLGCQPFNLNLIGTFKSLHQIPGLLKPGGRVVLFNEAPQGIGFHHWRASERVIQVQKEHYSRLLNPFQVAVFSPASRNGDFQKIFPEEFELINTVDELEGFMNRSNYQTLTVLPFAPVTLVL